jgi:hypothetical protein
MRYILLPRIPYLAVTLGDVASTAGMSLLIQFSWIGVSHRRNCKELPLSINTANVLLPPNVLLPWSEHLVLY